MDSRLVAKRMEGGEGTGKVESRGTFTQPGESPEAAYNGSAPQPQKPRCIGTTKAGERCKGYALGPAYPEVSHLCAGHAGLGRGRKAVKAAAPGTEPLGQRAGGTRPVDVRDTVRDALTEMDQAALKAYVQKAVLEGRDVRAITSLLDRVYSKEVARVEVPSTMAEMEKLTNEELDALIAQLEEAVGD